MVVLVDQRLVAVLVLVGRILNPEAPQQLTVNQFVVMVSLMERNNATKAINVFPIVLVKRVICLQPHLRLVAQITVVILFGPRRTKNATVLRTVLLVYVILLPATRLLSHRRGFVLLGAEMALGFQRRNVMLFNIVRIAPVTLDIQKMLGQTNATLWIYVRNGLLPMENALQVLMREQ